MTIATTYAKIVDLVEATSGIKTAPDALLGSIPPTDLPLALTLAGPATWNEQAVGLYRQVRTYTINVYVQPVGEGITPDEGYKACLTPLYNLGRTFVQNPTLDGTVDQIGVGERAAFSDSGVRVLTYAGQDYHGFAVTLQVTEKAT